METVLVQYRSLYSDIYKTVGRYLKAFQLSVLIWVTGILPAQAQLLPKNFTVEGRLFQADGVTPYAGNVDVMFDLIVQGDACVVYREEHINVDVDAANNALDGLFSMKLGSGAPPASWAGVTNIVPLFNSGAVIAGRNAADSAACTVTPAAGAAREVRISVQATGVATYAGRLATYEVLGPNNLTLTSVPGAFVAETLQGLLPADLIRVGGNRTETNVNSLVDGIDAGGLHHHDARYDSRYVGLNGTVAATTTVGIGTTTTAVGHLEVWKPNPTVYLNVTGTGTQASMIFAGLGTRRAKIESAVGVDGLNFYSGANAVPALQIDANSNVSASGWLTVGGGTTLGRYTNAQETAFLDPALTAPRSGTVWFNTQTSQLRLWNGTAKVDVLGISALNGDITASGPGVATATLANSSVTANKIADNSVTPQKINTAGLAVSRLVSTDASVATNNLVYVGCALNEVMSFNPGGEWQCTTPANLLAISKLPTSSLHQMGASSGQVLKWNGSGWTPEADSNDGDIQGVVTQSPLIGGSMAGVATVGLDPNFIAEIDARYIRGFEVSAVSPLEDDVLTWDDVLGVWTPEALPIGINANEISAYDLNGRLGVSTTSARATLDVNGAFLGRPAINVTGAVVNFLNGNLQYTNNTCGAYALHNLKDGGTYTFVVKGSGVTTCVFTAYSDAGGTLLTFHYPSGHQPTIILTHTLYNFVVIGNDVYASWSPGI